jgi:hypothetical protein
MELEFLPEIFLRAPFYGYKHYDLDALPTVLQREEFKNALYLASPDFYRLLEKKDFDYKALNQKEIFSLKKYYNRMCFRTTPFGSFSSFTKANWNEERSMSLCDQQFALLHRLFDQGLRTDIWKSLNDRNDQFNLILNPTCYKVGDDFRFVKTLTEQRGHHTYVISSIASEDITVAVFKLLSAHPVSNRQVLAWIVDRADCTEGDAQSYLRFLIEEQFLYTENQGTVIEAKVKDFGGNRRRYQQTQEILKFAEKIKSNL